MHKVIVWTGRVDQPVFLGESDLDKPLWGRVAVHIPGTLFTGEPTEFAPEHVCLDTPENRELIRQAYADLFKARREYLDIMKERPRALRLKFAKEIYELREADNA